MSVLSEFKLFVDDQPSDRPINQSEGWNECAVGDYAKTINRNAGAVADDIAQDHQHVFDVLNRHGRVSVGGRVVKLDTYGKLSEWLAEHV